MNVQPLLNYEDKAYANLMSNSVKQYKFKMRTHKRFNIELEAATKDFAICFFYIN